MESIVPVFNCSVRYQIGDGKGTTFWHNNWHGTPFKYKYPYLYQAMLNKQLSVRRGIDSITGLSLQPLLLTTVAQAEKERMLLEIQHFHISQEPDSIVWLRNSGNFSVSSAYKFLAHTPSPTSNLHNIWAIKAPLRVTVFAWLMLTNHLTTIDNLVKRGWHLPSMCVLCKKSEETVKHIFQQCPLAAEIRNYICDTTPPHHTIPDKFQTAASFNMLTDPAEKKIARQWEIVICFILWRERCRRIFSDKIESQMGLMR